MFETIAQGFTGIALLLSQFVLPMNEKLAIAVSKIEQHDAALLVKTKITLPIDRNIEDLVDAGMPLRLSIVTEAEGKPVKRVWRTLRFQTEKFTYTYVDSSYDGSSQSREYPMILLALKDYCTYETVVPASASSIKIRIEILPGRLDRINRTIDPRQLFGRHYAELETITSREGLEK